MRQLTAKRQTVLAELEKVRGKNRKKRLSPRELTDYAIKYAKDDPEHPLHGYYTWNIEDAAYRTWIEESREIIVGFQVHADNQFESAPVYVSVLSDQADGGGYRPVSEVISSGKLRTEAIETALRQLEQVQYRYERFQVIFGPVTKAIKEIKRRKRSPASRARSSR